MHSWNFPLACIMHLLLCLKVTTLARVASHPTTLNLANRGWELLHVTSLFRNAFVRLTSVTKGCRRAAVSLATLLCSLCPTGTKVVCPQATITGSYAQLTRGCLLQDTRVSPTSYCVHSDTILCITTDTASECDAYVNKWSTRFFVLSASAVVNARKLNRYSESIYVERTATRVNQLCCVYFLLSYRPLCKCFWTSQ